MNQSGSALTASYDVQLVILIDPACHSGCLHRFEPNRTSQCRCGHRLKALAKWRSNQEQTLRGQT